MTQDNSSSPPPQIPGGSPIGYATAPANAYAGPAASQDDMNMGMLIYILGIFTNFIGPLILWLLKKDQSPFINDQGKEVLNFQITTLIAYLICIPLAFVIIGFFLMPVVLICYLVFMIMGALKAKQGIAYRFPFALRLLK